MGVASGIDRTQRRVPIIGVPLAVIYKYFDDQGNYLAAVLTFYAFFAIFPLLLLATSILGFVLQGYPELEKEVLKSALAQFPIIGDEIGQTGGLRGSAGGIVFGALGALYGAVGLGLSLQNVQAAAWAVPRNNRPHPVLTRVTSLFLLATAGSIILAVFVLSAVLTETELVGSIKDEAWFDWAGPVGHCPHPRHGHDDPAPDRRSQGDQPRHRPAPHRAASRSRSCGSSCSGSVPGTSPA